MSIRDVLRAHLPRDRYDDEGAHLATVCSCGGWRGDYFADGDAGPFDDHLAAAIGEWLLSDQPVERAARVIADTDGADWSMPPLSDDTWPALRHRWSRVARAALTGAVEDR